MPKALQHKIKKIDTKDAVAFEALAKGGSISKKDMQNIITKTRAANWAHDKMFKEISWNDNNNKRYEGYSLTTEGKKYAERTFGITSWTKSKSSSILHDLKIGEKVVSVPLEDRNSIKTEEQLWDKLYEEMRNKQDYINELEDKRLDQSLTLQEREQYGLEWQREETEYNRIQEMIRNNEISAPDISYTNEYGVEVCYEVLTTNYSRADIAAKHEFAKALGMEIEFEQV